MKKILFLHGLNWSGSCPIARALQTELADIAEVVSPDLPVDPEEAIATILDICDRWQPDLLVGSSYGAFLGQQTVKIAGCPALMCSPMFRMADFLESRLGVHDFKSPRADGVTCYCVTAELVAKFREMEKHQFDCYDKFYYDRVWGFYGSRDTIADTRDKFSSLYSTVIEYDGEHTMSPDNVKTVLVPAVLKITETFPRREARYFRHFKGNYYRLVCHGRDSETLDRLVTYRALYGGYGFWVRPERMFFERITRDGKEFPRFAESQHLASAGVPSQKFAIFASGNGSNAENIIRFFRDHECDAEVALVVSNRRSAKVLERAAELNVPSAVMTRDELNDPDKVLPVMERYGITAIVLAGFLLPVPEFLIRRYPDRIINIHPALLPRFGGKGMYGMHVHEAVVAAGEKETGITIHYVNERYDEGKIICQAKIHIAPGCTPEEVAEMVHMLEYRHYPRVIMETFVHAAAE